ncbi:hypothetical protein E4U13_007059, partial [Claviceps humidiphila]
FGHNFIPSYGSPWGGSDFYILIAFGFVVLSIRVSVGCQKFGSLLMGFIKRLQDIQGPAASTSPDFLEDAESLFLGGGTNVSVEPPQHMGLFGQPIVIPH